ncbi:recombination signal binding protein for immunoglobulin kappa j region-like [Moniliophthora roreri]|nr:recombination signal binding protein for immunoglobulin kappa j region-like [Moniliophthora roreri]
MFSTDSRRWEPSYFLSVSIIHFTFYHQITSRTHITSPIKGSSILDCSLGPRRQ